MSDCDYIRVCLILGSEYLKPKHLWELEELFAETDAEVPLIAIDESTNNFEETETQYRGIRPSYLWEFLKLIFNKGPKTLIWAEAHLAGLISKEKTAYEKYRELESNKTHIDSIEGLSNANRIYFTPVKSGDVTYEIPNDILDIICSKSDVVVLMDFTKILRGRILTEPTYGTLSYHWSDIREYRGRPGCFWQFINNEDRIGVTLQQLTDELDGGNLVAVKHQDISDAKTWFEVRLGAIQLYGPLLTEAIEKFQEPNWEPEILTEDDLGKLTYAAEGYKLKNALTMVWKNLLGRIIR